MKIALAIESLAGGGSEHVVARLAHGLARRGHSVVVYCLRSANIDCDRVLGEGVTVREAHSVGRDPLLFWRLFQWLRHDRVDIAHAHSCAALVSLFPAAKLLHIPILHVWHGWPLGRPTRHHRIAEILDRFVDGVGINSLSLREKLPANRPCTDATHLPNGVDLNPADPRQARQALREHCGTALSGPVVLSVANIRPEKDLATLLHAFALLRREWPDAQLVCVGATGDKTYGRHVQDVTNALHLRDCVHLPGPRPDAWRLMAGADVFCLSSCSESFPNVILEAMSQRVPIVATTVGDIGRLDAHQPEERCQLRHNWTGLLVPPQDSEAMAAALACVLRDRSAAEQRAARAQADYRTRFTTGPMVQRYEQAYRACVHARQPRQLTASHRPGVLMLGPAPPDIGGMVTSISLLLESPLRERFALHRFGVHSRRPKTGRRAGRVWRSAFRHLRALASLGRTIAREQVEIVHIHTCSYFTFYRNLLDLAVAKLLRCKTVVHIRGGRFEQFCTDSGPIGRWLIRRSFRTTDAVVVLSERWRHALAPFIGRTPTFVIPNPAPPIPPTRPTAEDRADHACRFLYLAALTTAKGLRDLLEAAAMLRADGIPFELVVTGPAIDEPRSQWQQQVEQAGLDSHVRLHDPVMGAAKTQLLESVDCFVHPSHSEGLPNAILEAAAAGLPVIATAVGSVPELMQPDPREDTIAPLVPPHNPRALAFEMRRLATNPAMRRRIGQNLQQHVATHYSLATVADRITFIYHGLLGEQRKGPSCSHAAGVEDIDVSGPVSRETRSGERADSAAMEVNA